MNIEKIVREQLAYLAAGSADCVPEGGLEAKLRVSLERGTPLRVKQGIDPTSANVHIGHMVPFSLMRRFQDLGHTGIIIIGDVTAGIGDPTGRNAERPPLTRMQVESNAETYTKQIFTVVNKERTEVRRQSEWFDALDLPSVIRLMSEFSLAQLLAHETFRRRMDEGNRLSLHELLYPLLQAYDSVVVKADIELGGSDQRFNILCGRDLMRGEHLDPQIALIVPLLPGTDGEKMSKSRGNDIPVLAEPFDQFTRVMALGDNLIELYWRLLFSSSEKKLTIIAASILEGNHRVEKLKLAQAIVERFQGKDAAVNARERFLREISGNEIPSEMPEFHVGKNGMSLDQAVTLASGVSLSEARRLVTQGGVRIDGKLVITGSFQINFDAGAVILRVGEKKVVPVTSLKIWLVKRTILTYSSPVV